MLKSKQEIRKKMLALRDSTADTVLSRKNELINQTLISLMQNQVHNIHCFIPMEGEVDIRPFLQHALELDKKVYAPESVRPRIMVNRRLKCLQKTKQGIFGTCYPDSEEVFNGNFDLIIVPGLAFDYGGGRIGYGAGYYDFFLNKQDSAIKLGIAYDFQIFKELPQDEHDVQIDGLVYF